MLNADLNVFTTGTMPVCTVCRTRIATKVCATILQVCDISMYFSETQYFQDVQYTKALCVVSCMCPGQVYQDCLSAASKTTRTAIVVHLFVN